MVKRKPEKIPTTVSCISCSNCDLLQWGNDPIIADCKAKESREVAVVIRKCDLYSKENNLSKKIRHLRKIYGLITKLDRDEDI